MEKIARIIEEPVANENGFDIFPPDIRAKVSCAQCFTIGFCFIFHPDHEALCTLDFYKKIDDCVYCACALRLWDLDAPHEDYDDCFSLDFNPEKNLPPKLA